MVRAINTKAAAEDAISAAMWWKDSPSVSSPSRASPTHKETAATLSHFWEAQPPDALKPAAATGFRRANVSHGSLLPSPSTSRREKAQKSSNASTPLDCIGSTPSTAEAMLPVEAVVPVECEMACGGSPVDVMSSRLQGVPPVSRRASWPSCELSPSQRSNSLVSVDDARQQDSKHAERLFSAALNASGPAAEKMLSMRRDVIAIAAIRDARATSLSHSSSVDSAATDYTECGSSLEDLLIVNKHFSASPPSTPQHRTRSVPAPTVPLVPLAAAARPPSLADATLISAATRCLADVGDEIAALVLGVLGCGRRAGAQNFLAESPGVPRRRSELRDCDFDYH